MAVKTYLKLGDILVKEGLITEAQLHEAIKAQKTSGRRLGEVLVNMRYITEVQVIEVLARQLGLPYRSFEKGELPQADDPIVKNSLPQEVIRNHLVFPLSKDHNILTVALADPLDLLLMDNLKNMTGCQIAAVLATRSDLQLAIEATYGKRERLKEAVAQSYSQDAKPGEAAHSDRSEVVVIQEEAEAASAEELVAKAGEAQVVQLVDLFLAEAVKSRVSDIHIEPYPDRMMVRFRIDGVLQETEPPAPHLMLAIISRIKILSRMDIAEKRLPQDGSFTVRLGDKVVDLRVSTIPVIYGEKVVLRLLDKSGLVTNFKDLGIEGKSLQDVERSLSSPFGLIFITGPTGSGKSTTLYAALSRLKSPTKNILTIEDPVEYKVEGINQVQAKPQIGLTFAAGMRAFLRQDPDIIMVGEVRDQETAEICVRAALTGHLVLSTLHTNDAASAITRLIDIGIEPFLLSPSLVLIIAQRLVRKLCAECKGPFDPPPSVREKTKLPAGTYFQPKGCAKCRDTGYRGRVGIYEVLRTDEKIKEIIARAGKAEEIKEVARAQGMKSLLESGLDKAAAGISSLEEVFSVTVGEV